MSAFRTEISRHIWDTRYRYRNGEAVHDVSIEETWHRIARALASAENAPDEWTPRFEEVLRGFSFLPGGRIQAGAGTTRKVTLFNCFVMGLVPDNIDGIFESLKQSALTMQQGGGIGIDFSTLRPKGEPSRHVGTVASGPVSFMRIWDAMCATVLSTGARRGAMMATLRCDHPDINAFVAAKQQKGELRYFNLSVQVTDAFMQAVRDDSPWDLVFPDDQLALGTRTRTVPRRWTGRTGPVPCRVLRTVSARELWASILRSTYEYAEPGVLFIDRVHRLDNLGYREHVSATNPCGEVPLQPYGACNLGSMNLVAFVREPFASNAHIDLELLRSRVSTAVRMLDNVVDVSGFPLPAEAEQAKGTRRLGLGITGLGDALILLGLHYGSDEARSFARSLMEAIRDTAYRTSISLAQEKVPFPFFESEPYLASEFVRALPDDLRDGIARDGIRNSHLLAIAPAGTISLLANNVSSGIEPVYDFAYTRNVIRLDGDVVSYPLEDYAVSLWHEWRGKNAPLPKTFVSALELSPNDHLEMQAAFQPFVDNSISKTVNVPENQDFESFQRVYDRAWELGLKGCTTYRPNPVTGAVLTSARVVEGIHCATPERECD